MPPLPMELITKLMESWELKLCLCCIEPTNLNLDWAQRDMLLQLSSLVSICIWSPLAYYLHWLLQNILWICRITNNRSDGTANSDVCSWFDLAINTDEGSAANKSESISPGNQPKPLCPPKDLWLPPNALPFLLLCWLF